MYMDIWISINCTVCPLAQEEELQEEELLRAASIAGAEVKFRGHRMFPLFFYAPIDHSSVSLG